MTQPFEAGRPIYAQLMERLQQKIITGEYPPGARLESVRELAAAAAVNPNTMQRALATLEQQGLLRTERTSGRFVTDDLTLIGALRRQKADALVQQFICQMGQLGYTPDQLAQLIAKSEAPRQAKEEATNERSV